MSNKNRAPGANQRSVCDGKRTNSGGNELSRKRGSERSEACKDAIKQLEQKLEKAIEQSTQLNAICQKQRESLAAQQEAIVQLNISLDSTLACLAEKYGEERRAESGATECVLSIPTEAYPGVLDRCDVHAEIKDGCYVITVAPKQRADDKA